MWEIGTEKHIQNEDKTIWQKFNTRAKQLQNTKTEQLNYLIVEIQRNSGEKFTN